MVRDFDARALPVWRLAMRALDYAAVARTGRPLHALSPDEQDAVLRSWERSPLMRAPLTAVGAVLKLVHFDRATVYARRGGRPNLVPHLDRPRWMSNVHRASEWQGDQTLECDAVVVGTGAGGAVVGA